MPDQHSPQERRWTVTACKRCGHMLALPGSERLDYGACMGGCGSREQVEVVPAAALQHREAELGKERDAWEKGKLAVTAEANREEQRANQAEAALREARGFASALRASGEFDALADRLDQILGPVKCERCLDTGRETERRRAPVSEELYEADLGPCPHCKLDTSIGDREPEPECNCSPGLPHVGDYGKYTTAGCPIHCPINGTGTKPPAPCSDRPEDATWHMPDIDALQAIASDLDVLDQVGMKEWAELLLGLDMLGWQLTRKPEPSSSDQEAEWRERAVRNVVDFLDAWRHCPVSTASAPSHSCLEDAAKQLVDALLAISTQPAVPVPSAVPAPETTDQKGGEQ